MVPLFLSCVIERPEIGLAQIIPGVLLFDKLMDSTIIQSTAECTTEIKAKLCGLLARSDTGMQISRRVGGFGSGGCIPEFTSGAHATGRGVEIVFVQPFYDTLKHDTNSKKMAFIETAEIVYSGTGVNIPGLLTSSIPKGLLVQTQVTSIICQFYYLNEIIKLVRDYDKKFDLVNKFGHFKSEIF